MPQQKIISEQNRFNNEEKKNGFDKTKINQ